MITGSHTLGMIEHNTTKDKNNVLLQGQTVEGVNEKDAILCPLLSGEAHFIMDGHFTDPNLIKVLIVVLV